MKLYDYPETDSLYIELRAEPGVEAREVAPGLVADFDAAGAVVGLDIDGGPGRWTCPRWRQWRCRSRARGPLDLRRGGEPVGGAPPPT